MGGLSYLRHERGLLGGGLPRDDEHGGNVRGEGLGAWYLILYWWMDVGWCLGG